MYTSKARAFKAGVYDSIGAQFNVQGTKGMAEMLNSWWRVNRKSLKIQSSF
jgi:hypothetical protein